MKPSRTFLTTVWLIGIIPAVSLAQDSGNQVVTPNGVTVSAASGQILEPGQNFPFILHFAPAPDKFGDGAIVEYRFENISQKRNQYEALSFTQTSDRKPLQDGQAVYSFTLMSNDSMVPGTWKLTSVIVGRRNPREILIQTDVTFEILSPTPVTFHIQAPPKAVAGQSISVKLTIDAYPKHLINGCPLRVFGELLPTKPDPRQPPNPFTVNLGSVKLQPDVHSYQLTGAIDKEAPGGVWEGGLRLVASSAFVDNYHGIGMDRYCPTPLMKGDSAFSVTVQSGPEEIFPQAVSVTVNPSQIELLRGEADRLKAKAVHLKDQLTSNSNQANDALLRDSLAEALADVDKTEKTFKEKGHAPSLFSRAVNAFFDDIRYDYGEDLKILGQHSAQASDQKLKLKLVSSSAGGTPARLNPASQAVLKSILRNAKIYSLAASSGVLTFTLEVHSVPEDHATISYRQRGDKDYTFVSHQTDWQIENLPIGVYLIRVQKAGFLDNEQPFDAATTSIPSITIRMEKK